MCVYVCVSNMNEPYLPLPVRLCVSSQMFQCWIEVHEAGGLVHDSSRLQSARPAENTRHPDPTLPPRHSLSTYVRNEFKGLTSLD